MTSVGAIAAWVDGKIIGDASREIGGVADLASAGPEHLSFLTDTRYSKSFAATRAGCVLVKANIAAPSADCTLIVCDDPYVALAHIATRLYRPAMPPAGIAAGAMVAPDCDVDSQAIVCAGAVIETGAKIGARAYIGALCYVGAHCSIGEDTLLHPGAKVMPRCHIGARVILQAGCVIGSDGFGFATDRKTGRHHKIPQVGSVRIADDVEIGANSTIDRATFGETVIGRGTKIDNLVQIAHNVALGANNIIVSQTGIAGSSELGDNVVLGAQAGVAGHLRICDQVMIAARAGVIQNITEAGVYSGMFGVMPHRQALKITLAQACVPELRHRVKRLETKLDGLASLPNKP
jgi:UDP-3-O-[3-hydroxymyristoyl] glucosamine N-acyltransferase